MDNDQQEAEHPQEWATPGELEEWANQETTAAFLGQLQEDRSRALSRLLARCSSTTDPEIARFYGMYQAYDVTVKRVDPQDAE